jgi:hypothetical protein
VSCPLTPSQAAGSYTLAVSFAGDDTYAAASRTASFAVTHEQTTLSYDGPFRIANGSPATLTGTLLEDGSTAPNPSGQSVTFTLGSGSSAQTCTGTVDSTGHVQCTIANVQQPDGTFTVPVSDSFAGDAYYLASSGSGTARLVFYTGRAYGASTSLLGGTPTLYADTGQITTAQSSQTQRSLLSATFGVLGTGGSAAGVTGSVTTGAGTSHSTASVASFTIGGLLVPTVQATGVSGSSQSTCTAATGSTTVGSLTVNGRTIPVGNPAPNTTLNVAGLTITLNEQQAVSGADHGLTVNAIHIVYPGLANYVFSSASSDIHNC